MTILFGGGEMGAFVPSDSTANEAFDALGGAGASYDAGFARCYIAGNGDTSYVESWEWAGQTDIWIHAEIDQNFVISSGGTLKQTMTFLNSSGAELLRLACSANTSGEGNWAVQLNVAGTWTTLGSVVATNSHMLQVVDFHFVVNSATGVADLYIAGTKRISNPSVDLSSVANIAQVRCYGKTLVVQCIQGFSQAIAATTSTIGKRLMTIVPTGAGTTANWTGSYTAIDDPAYSDADFMYSDAADEVQLFSGTAVGSLSGYSVEAVVVTARAKKDGAGPANIQMALRTQSTNYFSSTIALDAGYTANVAVWETNPNTGLAWTAADIAALQFGMKSIA